MRGHPLGFEPEFRFLFRAIGQIWPAAVSAPSRSNAGHLLVKFNRKDAKGAKDFSRSSRLGGRQKPAALLVHREAAKGTKTLALVAPWR
jgi:hypothetical protein